MKPHQHGDVQLESALRSLPLRQPSDLLDHRITRAITRRVFPWRGLTAAACFGGLCFWFGLTLGQAAEPDAGLTPADMDPVEQQSPPTNTTPGPRLVSGPTRIDAQWPIAQAQLSYDIDTGPPIRATIQDAIERTHWVDPENNRDIELIRPVREVTLTRQNPY